ncbi:MAG: acyl-CoA dehydrogenase family protein, partial [Chloroflexi bacterium]|nr:acyl-CoA dehydrogenase family protein [Chloroflexota bacterium]
MCRASATGWLDLDFTFTAEQDAFRDEVRRFIREHMPGGPSQQLGLGDEHNPDFYQALADAGYVGMQWPREHGGQERSHVDMAIFYEEMSYAGAPTGRYTGSVVFVGESIVAYGSEQQRLEFLPRIARGEITCCWALSEPEAGSDAAAISTRAELDAAGGYVLTGQKIFTSGAHLADYAMVAARTNPSAPKHRGISLFLVPMKLDGVTVQPLWTIAGWHVNQVFFDGVMLPANALLGKQDEGWNNIRITLSFERSAIGKVGMLMRLFDHMRWHVEQHGSAAEFGGRLAGFRGEIEALRWMAYHVAWLQDQGEAPDALASMNKLRSSELALLLSELGMEIAGVRGAERGQQ